MTDKEVITMLLEQNAKLMGILEKFAEQPTNIVVNSYNGSNATSTNDKTSTNNFDQATKINGESTFLQKC